MRLISSLLVVTLVVLGEVMVIGIESGSKKTTGVVEVLSSVEAGDETCDVLLIKVPTGVVYSGDLDVERVLVSVTTLLLRSVLVVDVRLNGAMLATRSEVKSWRLWLRSLGEVVRVTV